MSKAPREVRVGPTLTVGGDVITVAAPHDTRHHVAWDTSTGKWAGKAKAVQAAKMAAVLGLPVEFVGGRTVEASMDSPLGILVAMLWAIDRGVVVSIPEALAPDLFALTGHGEG